MATTPEDFASFVITDPQTVRWMAPTAVWSGHIDHVEYVVTSTALEPLTHGLRSAYFEDAQETLRQTDQRGKHEIEYFDTPSRVEGPISDNPHHSESGHPVLGPVVTSKPQQSAEVIVDATLGEPWAGPFESCNGSYQCTGTYPSADVFPTLKEYNNSSHRHREPLNLTGHPPWPLSNGLAASYSSFITSDVQLPGSLFNNTANGAREVVGSPALTVASITRRRSRASRYFCEVPGCSSEGFTTKYNYDCQSSYVATSVDPSTHLSAMLAVSTDHIRAHKGDKPFECTE
ncbi:hypothetical protein PQX77_002362, partial [Marasmius sp. AFHP31]